MQIKDQRVTSIKQKYEPKFEPITFTVEKAPGIGSIYGQLSTGAEQRRLAFEGVDAVSSEINAVMCWPSCWATADNQDPRRIGIAGGDSKHTAIHAESLTGTAAALLQRRSSTMNVRQ